MSGTTPRVIASPPLSPRPLSGLRRIGRRCPPDQAAHPTQTLLLGPRYSTGTRKLRVVEPVLTIAFHRRIKCLRRKTRLLEESGGDFRRLVAQRGPFSDGPTADGEKHVCARNAVRQRERALNGLMLAGVHLVPNPTCKRVCATADECESRQAGDDWRAFHTSTIARAPGLGRASGHDAPLRREGRFGSILAVRSLPASGRLGGFSERRAPGGGK